jgi:hypothetical protein
MKLKSKWAVVLPRLVRQFRDENRFAGGHYTVRGIELSLPCGKLRLGRMILPPPIKPPSIAYIGRRHTWTWTIRLWTAAISYLPNADVDARIPASQDSESITD